jgi:predicted nucleic acid-binding protein
VRRALQELAAEDTEFERLKRLERDVDLVDRALAAKARWEISYWDAAILEAARLTGCTELLSEDLASGQDYGGVRCLRGLR